MKYSTLEKMILGLLALYLLVGATYKFLPAHHLYPFFSWDLYSTIPNTFSIYDIRFTHVGNKNYDTPKSYKDLFSDRENDFFLLAEDLSISVKNGNNSRITISQKELRNMVGESIGYDLIELTYSPLDYKNGKPPLETKNLGHFELQ